MLDTCKNTMNSFVKMLPGWILKDQWCTKSVTVVLELIALIALLAFSYKHLYTLFIFRANFLKYKVSISSLKMYILNSLSFFIKHKLINRTEGNDKFIYFAVVAVNLMAFTAGGCYSWPAPVLAKLSSTDPNINPLSKPTTIFEQTWITSTMNLGAIVGPLAGGLFSEMIGKKKTLLLMGIPMVVSHLLCAFGINIHFFLIARFIIGVGVGTVFGVVPGYVGDISEDKNRGVLSSALGMICCSGVLFVYLIGPFLSVRILSLINIFPMILFYALFGCCIPESPFDLVKRGNQKAAEEALMKLRNKSSGDVEKELVSIVETVEANRASQNNGIIIFFKNKALTKGMIISNGVMFFQQLSGIGAVTGYLQNIFDSAGSSIPSIYSVMIVGVIQLIANIISVQLVEKAGRKMLLIISYIFSIISLVSLGAYFHLKTSGINVDQISWLPIASLIVYVTAFNLGMSNIPWVLLAELFPANVKALAATITSFFVFSLSFFITLCFPYLSAAVGMAGSFWIFAACLVAGFIFTVVLVPETKGKSNQDIQHILEGSPK